jgi:cell division protein FtsL
LGRSSLYEVPEVAHSRDWTADKENYLKAKAEAARLKIEEIRLLAMREEQATHLRIDKVARERLHMQTATPAVTLYMDAVASQVVAP